MSTAGPAESGKIHAALAKVVAGEDLSRAEAEAITEEILSGRASDAQAAALKTALWMKGVTKDEIAGMEEARRRHASEPAGTCRTGTEIFAPERLSGTSLLLVLGQDLSRKEAENAMEEILSGRASDMQIAQFLTALRFKGETLDEIVGFATAMRRHATPIFPPGSQPGSELLVDTCGTGGDASGTFNVSTAAAFVVAGAGVRVAKHGNRSISSNCGSADVIEALGIRLEIPPQKILQAIEEIGIGFLFAPAMHAAMRHAARARRELKMRTVFNLLGPLTNPAGARAQVVGVYDAALVELMARALGELGVVRAFVVHGADGMDEISLSGETHVAELRDATVRTCTVVPEDFGLRRAPREALQGGDAKHNAQIIRRILDANHGPHREIVLANAAAALVAAGRATDFLAGVRLASHSIDSGAARAKLEALAAFTSRC